MKNLIRQTRQMRGLTQAQLAERVGTTAATVSRLEKDSMTVSTEWLTRFASVLGVHPSDLLERPDRPSLTLLGRTGRDGHVISGSDGSVVIELPTNDAVAIEVWVPQGPYAAGERLVGERLHGASMVSAIGRDCIVALKSGSLMLARVIAAGRKFTLVPPEPGATILYDQDAEWIAPLVIRVKRIP